MGHSNLLNLLYPIFEVAYVRDFTFHGQKSKGVLYLSFICPLSVLYLSSICPLSVSICPLPLLFLSFTCSLSVMKQVFGQNRNDLILFRKFEDDLGFTYELVRDKIFINITTKIENENIIALFSQNDIK